MNERIKTLIKESGGHNIAYEGRPGSYSYAFTDNSMEKFAELIVKESLSVLKDMHLWQSVNNQNYPGAWHDAVDQSINTIKEHFGVSE